MEKNNFKFYSSHLNREMEGCIYGHAGRPMLFIPCQDGHYYDFENFHMTETLAPWIESGQLQVFSIDTIDKETWSDTNAHPGHRAWLHECWMQYIFTEVAPFIKSVAEERNNGYNTGIIACGFSLGATHAVNIYMRHPDIFDGCMALSGIYTGKYGFGDYMDENVYNASAVDYMRNLPADHPYVEMFNHQRAVVCVGQGAWEQPETTRELSEICKSKGINTWFDFWGFDVNHDWPWWYKQAVYFMPYLLWQD